MKNTQTHLEISYDMSADEVWFAVEKALESIGVPVEWAVEGTTIHATIQGPGKDGDADYEPATPATIGIVADMNRQEENT